MSSIRKRGGRYQVRYRSPFGAQHSQTFGTEREAKDFAARNHAALADGDWLDPARGKRLFRDIAEGWRSMLDGEVRPSTKATYESVLDKHVLPYFGRMKIGSIRAGHIRQWLGDMTKSGVGDAARTKAYNVLRLVLRTAVESELIRKAPLPSKGVPSLKKREMTILTPGEVAGLSDAMGPWYSTLVVFAAHSGMRWGEIAGLRLDRLDLLHRKVRIDSQLGEVNGRLYEGPPKTPWSARTISIPPFLVPLLEEQIGERSASGLVFPTPGGSPMRRSNFGRLWRPTVERLGRKGLTVHDLRHTHASWLLENGLSVTAVAKRLGHRDGTITLAVYSHLMADTDDRITAKLEELHASAIGE